MTFDYLEEAILEAVTGVIQSLRVDDGLFSQSRGFSENFHVQSPEQMFRRSCRLPKKATEEGYSQIYI